MKRFFALAALVLGLAACQTEPEGLDVNVGGEVDTTITVAIPDTETRATDSAEGAFKNVVASDEYTIRYILQVFYKGNESHAARQVIYSDNKVVSFPVRLVPGRDYNFVVWADVVMQSGKTLNELGVYDANADLHYNTANLKSIELKGEWKAMDETRDAFTGHFDTAVDGDKTPYNGAKSINIPLTRPFAKLRIITTDMEQLNDLGIEPKTATVEYTVDHYNAFNAFAGKVIGDSKNRDIKHENFEIKAYGDNVDDKSMVLFTDYFFAADQEEVVNFNLSVYDQDNVIIGKETNFNTPIPARRNYLTTITGDILTDGNNIKVEVEDNGNFDGEIVEKIVEVGNATDLQEAIDNSTAETTILLGGDINLNDGIITLAATRAGENAGLIVPAGKSVVLDLNGYTIYAHDYATAGYALITNKGNLTINGEGTLKITGAENNRGWGAYSSVISNQVGGNLTVNAGVTIEHFGGTAMAYGIDNLTNGKGTSAIVTINGATVKSTYRAVRQFLNGVEATNELYVNKDSRVESTGGNKAIWMQDPSKNANTGKLVVAEGASVHSVYLDVTPGSTEWPVEVSVAASSLTDTSENKGIYTDGIPAGYEVVLENGVYTVLYTCAAKIGDVEYPSLQAAVEAVEDGETIVLNRNIEQVDGVIITDKNITIDLNNKTFTVSEGANTNNRNFKVNGSSVVTIKNGTMIAAGEYSSGAYGTLRTEGTAEVTLENVLLYNYRGNGLNVKALSGTTVTINDSEIYSQYGGGVEAAGGTIELTNVKIEQKGVYSSGAWCSVAIGVNGNGNVTINSGNYSASTIASDSNAAQGTWVAYVMSSGGTLNIKGGTFNGVVAETASAANACGLICADTKAIVNIYGGTFSSNGAILDMRNNTGGTPNPSATLFGGTFSADPRVSGLYASHLISVAEGFKVENNNGRWTVVVDPAAKIGDTEYATLSEAFNVGGNITLLRDVTVAETVVLAEGKTVVLDLNGKTLAAADKNVILNNGGVLTIKNGTVTRTGDVVGYSVNNASGEITVENATIKRGLYTSGSKMTATNANISHEQSSRHAIYAWNCAVTINSGNFHNDNAGNATLMASGSSIVTINGGTFSIADGRSTLGWTSSMIDQKDTAQVIVKGGLFNGGFRINSADTTLTIEGGEFNTNNGSAFTDYSGTKVVKGGKFTDAGAQNWAKKYIAEGYEMNANGEVVAK